MFKSARVSGALSVAGVAGVDKPLARTTVCGCKVCKVGSGTRTVGLLELGMVLDVEASACICCGCCCCCCW